MIQIHSPLPLLYRPERWQGRTLALSLVLVAGIGATLSLLLFSTFSAVRDEQVRAHLTGAGQMLPLYAEIPELEEMVEQAYTLFSSAALTLQQQPTIDQAGLDSLLWAEPPPAFASAALEYLPRRTPNGGYLTDISLDSELASLPVMRYQQGALLPVTAPGDYFPVMLESSYIGPMAPVGLDRGNHPLIQVALQEARDSGLLTSFTSYPTLGSEQEFLVAHFYFPLYAAGREISTVEARREFHTGYLSLVTYTPTKDFLPFMSEAVLGIDVATFPLERPPQPGRWGQALGEQLLSGDLVNVLYPLGDVYNSMLIAPNDELRKVLDSPARWWALSGGLLLTLLGCAAILRNRQQALFIARLVEQRTHDLAEQTARLESVNEALGASEQRYRMLAENISDVIYTFNAEARFTYLSPSVERQAGFSVAALQGERLTAVLSPHDERRVQRLLVCLDHALAEGRVSTGVPRLFDFTLRCPQGEERIFETAVSLLALPEQPSEALFLGVARDVTARRQAERERARFEQAYRHSQKMEAIGTLAGGVAHDFNNLLTALMGHAELLREKVAAQPDAVQSVAVIEKAAERAKALTSQLLGFARKGRFQSVSVDINQVVGDVASFVRRTMDKKVLVTFLASERPVSVTGDPVQMSQVVMNLAINAGEAMPKGGELTLQVDSRAPTDRERLAQPSLKDEPYCVITVMDTGIGIPRHKQKRIFEPFFTDRLDGQGTGMGLAMVYGVVEGHGGVVTVDSEPGQGATFTVWLPLADGLTSRDSEEACPPPGMESAERGNGCILVVDDEGLVRALARQMLNKLGYEVLQAEDGLEALDIYRAQGERIDLVLLDLVMPRMGGLDCLRELTALDNEVQVLLSSGYNQEQIDEALQQPQVVGFLHKPYRLHELARLVAAGLSTRVTS